MSEEKEPRINLKDQRFGVEIEFYGISRSDAAELVKSLVCDENESEELRIIHCHENGLDTYKAASDDGRMWKIVSDSSVRGEACELVTPVLTYDDVRPLQDIVRVLSCAGARSDASCGIHIHIDGSNHDARSIRNLCLICASKEDIMLKALEVPEERYDCWCRKADKSFVDYLIQNKNPTLEEIERAYYTVDYIGRHRHYHPNRYRLVNLHDYFNGHGTIEFRAFNGESKKHTRHLHAGEVKAYIDFCLAISAQAINNTACRYHAFDHQNERYTYRTWLIGHHGLNLNGDEFKNTRSHLLGKLVGDTTYKDREAALARREKKKASQAVEELRPQIDRLMDQIAEMPQQQRSSVLGQLSQLASAAGSSNSSGNDRNGGNNRGGNGR